VAICFAEGGSRVPTSGGVYGLVEAAFGPLAGYVSGTLLWVCSVLACGAVAAALADVVASLFPASFTGPVRAAVIVGVIGGIALVNIGGVVRGARLVSAITTVKLAPLAIFIVAGASAIHRSNFSGTVEPDAQGLGRAVILAVFALVGMEASLCASGEVTQPNRTIPRALAIAMLSTTVLYVAIQVIAQGILGSSLATSKAPLADAMAHIHPALRALMLAGTALSMFGWLGSDLLGSPRQLFAFARDGQLPRVLGRLHPRSHAPYIAILCYATLAIVLALTGTFAELVVLSTLAIAALYVAGCAASWALARQGVALSGTPLNFRFLGTATVIGICSMLTLIALGSRQEIFGLTMLIGVSTLVYLVQARSTLVRPQ
jgi:amino acid transporter